MEFLHTSGVSFVELLQNHFQNHSELMLLVSHLGDPRNAFLIYFPLVYCLHKRTGEVVLWLACISECLNAIFKWLLHGERPFWWVGETDVYQGQTTPRLQQYRLTCETGPGSPSGHAMITTASLLPVVLALVARYKTRRGIPCLSWMLFSVFMLCVNVSRCFIATHFPHQVLFGTLTGALLAVAFSYVHTESMTLKHYALASLLIPVSCALTIVTVQSAGLDPNWSITKATKWCARPEWIHIDTQPFNSIMRDAGSILGYGLSTSIFPTEGNRTPTSGRVKVLHIIISLILCQVFENYKLTQIDPLLYYVFTFVKFCVLIFCATLVTKLFVQKGEEHKKSN